MGEVACVLGVVGKAFWAVVVEVMSSHNAPLKRIAAMVREKVDALKMFDVGTSMDVSLTLKGRVLGNHLGMSRRIVSEQGEAASNNCFKDCRLSTDACQDELVFRRLYSETLQAVWKILQHRSRDENFHGVGQTNGITSRPLRDGFEFMKQFSSVKHALVPWSSTALKLTE